jgi:tRNA threonylcarbamoyladenosine biosynthesis protein TsaB
MNILALETSTEYCSIALWQDGVIEAKSVQIGQKHSEVMMLMLAELLREANVKLTQLDGIAYGAGPGSFTGVRIACGVTQGLALGANLPVIGISTLQAVAQASGKDKVIVALDARMAEVYFAAYEKRGSVWLTVCEPCLCLPQNTPIIADKGWLGAGSGFAVHGDVLQQRFERQLEEIDAACMPQAGAIAQLAAPLFADGLGMDAAQAMPLYLRDKVALKTSERLINESSK